MSSFFNYHWCLIPWIMWTTTFSLYSVQKTRKRRFRNRGRFSLILASDVCRFWIQLHIVTQLFRCRLLFFFWKDFRRSFGHHRRQVSFEMAPNVAQAGSKCRENRSLGLPWTPPENAVCCMEGTSATPDTPFAAPGCHLKWFSMILGCDFKQAWKAH